MAKFFTSSIQDPIYQDQQTLVLPNVIGFSEETDGGMLVWTKDSEFVPLRDPVADAQRFKDEWATYLSNQSIYNKRRVYFPAPDYVINNPDLATTGWTFLARVVSNYRIGIDSIGQYCYVYSPMWPDNLLTRESQLHFIYTYDATAIQNLKDALNEIHT